ncbi:DUF4148 domain-containing protein [Undibacterium terreum]|uniref:DUF4148 domain-containing protein n=1 Tax=Undibacterium terreum TaxID=1224302 RepID=A0A916UDJ2_9BURK|nr:DUF4148 domain-containing protein [Undibacterium terreum]GGC68511.1 hypothetical protein GCM10011396_14430 [Undibacterium terreum]
MNAKKLIMLLALTAASSVAFSQDVQTGNSGEGKTRQQVVNELNQARAQGLLNFSDADYPVIPAAQSTLSRAQVVAGIQEARKDGSLFADTDYDYPHVAATPSGAGKTRAEVKAGIAMARADGTLFAPDWDYPAVVRAQAEEHFTSATDAKTASHS